MNNYNLCHIKTIEWDEIITGPGAKLHYVYKFAEPERDCTPCHESCEAGCWGEGARNCQKFSKINCSPQCGGGRCFGSRPRECCHQYCAGGCTGPTQSDCLVSYNFKFISSVSLAQDIGNDGEIVLFEIRRVGISSRILLTGNGQTDRQDSPTSICLWQSPFRVKGRAEEKRKAKKIVH